MVEAMRAHTCSSNEVMPQCANTHPSGVDAAVELGVAGGRFGRFGARRLRAQQLALVTFLRKRKCCVLLLRTGEERAVPVPAGAGHKGYRMSPAWESYSDGGMVPVFHIFEDHVVSRVYDQRCSQNV